MAQTKHNSVNCPVQQTHWTPTMCHCLPIKMSLSMVFKCFWNKTASNALLVCYVLRASRNNSMNVKKKPEPNHWEEGHGGASETERQLQQQWGMVGGGLRHSPGRSAPSGTSPVHTQLAQPGRGRIKKQETHTGTPDHQITCVAKLCLHLTMKSNKPWSLWSKRARGRSINRCRIKQWAKTSPWQP